MTGHTGQSSTKTGTSPNTPVPQCKLHAHAVILCPASSGDCQSTAANRSDDWDDDYPIRGHVSDGRRAHSYRRLRWLGSVLDEVDDVNDCGNDKHTDKPKPGHSARAEL